jgi:4-hydroxy-3-methylbut-2-enyl diphosphate reductase
MRITVATTSGFCMGVRRAVEMVLDAPGQHETPIYTYGPLIHNPQVLDLLEEKGITALTEIPEKGEGTVLIRAHGVPPEAVVRLEAAGFTVIDATCPRVIKVQRIIRKHADDGQEVIIIGDADHPEVIGLLGHAGGRGHVAGSMADLAALPPFAGAIVVAQTTQNTRFFETVKAWVADTHPHYRIFDTICDSTEKRQAEVKRLAETVDALVVVGGRNSGNTRRLADIARSSGKRTVHVETESELDPERLAGARSIGITAGASTPNWIIRRIYRTLEAMPYSARRNGWRRRLFALQHSLLLTNIYVSLGAGCLCYACSRLQTISHPIPYIIIAVLYVLSMHIFNHLTGREEDRYNDPHRARFYEIHKRPLAALAVAAGAAGLLTAFAVGPIPFLTLLAMSLMGLSYNLRFLPEGKYRRIRDIPGSKTILIALAWGVVTSVFPPLSERGGMGIGDLLVFLGATGLVFVRTVFFDILDMQGDRIVGKETIAIILGEKRSLTLLKRLLWTVGLILLLSVPPGLLPGLALLLILCPVFLYIVIRAHERGHMLPGIRLQFLVESHFLLSGLLTLVWSAAVGG